MDICYLCKKIIHMKEKIIRIIYQKLPYFEGEITMQSDFYNDLSADSLDIVDITFAVEKEFGIIIREEEMYSLDTVGDLVHLVEKKCKELPCVKDACGQEKSQA